MMGKSHAMSASAVALGATALGVGPLDATTTPLSVIALYTAVMVGGSLWPDWDSHGSTVVRSFGLFGKGIHELVNGIGVMIYNLTRSKRDGRREGGHRTFFHTFVAALLTGGVISGLSSLPGDIIIFGHTFTLGQLCSLVIMWLFLHVGLAGLFEKTIKKARGLLSVYGVMLGSLGGTFLVAVTMPEGQNYWWLGFAAVGGIIIHMLGDMITKQGVPLLWPIPIIGKRWYEISLPSFMRITAGGAFEKSILFPIFVTITIVGAIFCIPPLAEWARPFIDQITPW